jgi:hypothetical protein
MLAYLGMFTIALFLAGRRLGGWLGGTIATVTLLWVAWDIYDLGLRVLGEVPSLTFFCLGAIALARTNPRAWLLSGICIGLAMLTKPQMMIAVGALLLALGSWHYRCDRDCQMSTVFALIGVALPVAIWELTQLLILGPSEWYGVKEGAFLLITSEDFAGGLSAAGTLLKQPAIIALIFAILSVSYCLLILFIHRIPQRVTYVLRVLVFLPTIVAFPLIQWDNFLVRLLSLWSDHSIEILIGILGLLLSIPLALIRNDRCLALIAVSGILFAEWSLGISQVFSFDTGSTLDFRARYTFYWRILGLLSFGIVGAALLQYFWQPLARDVEHWAAGRPRAARMIALLSAFGVTGSLIAHALPQIRYSLPGDYDSGVVATARWVAANTPSDALLLGDGWWMPWEVAYLADREVGNARTSGFGKLSDFRRPLYLATGEHLVGHGWLLPSTEALLRRDDLRLFRHGTYSIVQWPRSPALEALSKMEHVDLNILAEIEVGRATLTPAPREGMLDQKHGQFIFPAPRELRQGLTMIAPASVSTRPFHVQQNSRLLLGYTPPDAGDGLRLSVSVRGPSGEQAIPLWERDIAPGGTYELHEIPLESFSAPERGLTISVSSPSGDASADWLHISPLIVGSW